MKYISWTEVAAMNDEYFAVLHCEPLGHLLHVDKNGTIRFEEKPERAKEIMDSVGAKDLNEFYEIYYDQFTPDYDEPAKNNKLFRELYKCRGYSINGFWEVFYWEMNNEDVDDFKCRNCLDAD